MSLIHLLFALELSYLPVGGFVQYQPTLEDIDSAHTVGVTMEAGVQLWYLYAKGSILVYAQPDTKMVAFWPWLGTYGLEAGFRRKWLSVGWRHYCLHPIVAYAYANYARPWLEGGYDLFFVRLEVNHAAD